MIERIRNNLATLKMPQILDAFDQIAHQFEPAVTNALEANDILLR